MALYRSPDYQTSFKSIGLSVQEKVQYRFSRWRPWWPSWISNQNDFSNFYLQATCILPMKFPVNWPFGSGEKFKTDFKHGGYGNHLGFLIEQF